VGRVTNLEQACESRSSVPTTPSRFVLTVPVTVPLAARLEVLSGTPLPCGRDKVQHMSECSICARPIPDHDRHVRFKLPDPVLDTDLQDSGPDAWRNGPDANQSTMLIVPQLGAFVRALLPVALTGGHTVTFGVWVAVRNEDLHHAFEVWWKPEYASLQLDGYLANHVAPWNVLRAPVQIAVLHTDETPYCTSSEHAELRSLLTTEWPHDEVLRALPA
jgi:hypothetical protein